MRLSDERGIVVAWLVRLVLGLAVAGLILFEVGAIAVNAFTLSSTAGDIAVALSTSAAASGAAGPNEGQLENEGQRLAEEAGATLVSIEVDRSNRVVYVTLRRKADTLFDQRFSAIKGWGRATAEGQAGYQ